MNYVIVEDEKLAADRLEKIITKLRPEWKLLAKATSVTEAIRMFQNNRNIDLAFLDIHLGDGDSFSIFDNIELTIPVIFTTAYEDYSIKAFKVNSIDYILKPISADELEFAIEKYEKLKGSLSDTAGKLKNAFPDRKKRYLITYGNSLKTVELSEIAFFYSESKSTFIMTWDGKSYPIEKSLDKLEGEVDPGEYFRINRKYFVALKAIKNMSIYGPSRIKLELVNCKDEDVFVARERYQEFKDWLDK